jgi:hypothetical protein
MHFQDVALSLVQPGNHDEFIAHRKSFKPPRSLASFPLAAMDDASGAIAGTEEAR